MDSDTELRELRRFVMSFSMMLRRISHLILLRKKRKD